MQKYNLEDYKELRALIAQQAVLYREAYGKSGRDYEQTKMKDLYERLGNAILKEMREFDKNYAGDINELYNENHIEQVLEPVLQKNIHFLMELNYRQKSRSLKSIMIMIMIWMKVWTWALTRDLFFQKTIGRWKIMIN